MKKGLSTGEMPDSYHEVQGEGEETHGDSENYGKLRERTECSFSDLMEDIAD